MGCLKFLNNKTTQAILLHFYMFIEVFVFFHEINYAKVMRTVKNF
jgi:hypothetical protein